MPRALPPSNALQFNEDLSTSWRQHLNGRHGLGPQAALDAAGRYSLVYEFDVDAARALGFSVEHTPDGPVPAACAHTSVWYPENAIKPERKRLRNELARQMVLVYGQIAEKPPPGA